MVDRKPNALDSLHRCLADQRRRYVLSYLGRSEDGTASIDDLVDYIVAQETNSPAPDRDDVSVSLYHVHLPMLAENGLIDFDTRSKTARYAPGSAEPVLEALLRSDGGSLAENGK